MHLSCTDTEIQGFKDFDEFDLLGSHDVIGHVTVGLGICGLLLVVHWTMRLSCTVYLAPLRRYLAPNIMGSRVWPFGVTWRHRSRDHSTRHMWFPIGGPLEPCVYLAPLQRYKASKLDLPMLKAKSSLRMLRVTWPIGRGAKMTTYLEFPSLYCLFTIQLLWGYDDD